MDGSIALVEFSKPSRRFRCNLFNYAHVEVWLNIRFPHRLERLEALSPAKPAPDAHAGASKLQAAYRGKTVRAKAKQPPDDAAKVATFVRAAIRGSFAQLVARGP